MRGRALTQEEHPVPCTTPDTTRTSDELLQLPGISELTTISEASLRWMRHNGDGPPLFRLGRRLVAWRSDVVAWIEESRLRDQRGDQ